jgi:uncharacterized protein YdgA (DUF945 family)
LVIAVLGVAGGAPYWFGMQAESLYNDKILPEIAKSGEFVVTKKSYDRGWLTSTAQTTLTLTGTSLSITITNRIQHGPIPLEGDLELRPVLARVKTQATLDAPGAMRLPPLTGQTTFNLDGSSTSTFSVAALNNTLATGTVISWQGLTGDATMSADFKHITAKMLSPMLQITSGDDKLLLTKATLSTDLKEGASGLRTGSWNYSVEKIGVEGLNGKTAMSGLALTSMTTETAGILSSSLDVKVQSWGDGVTSYGPGMIGLKLRNLDAATLVKFRKDIQALEAKNLPPEQLPSLMMGKMLEFATNIAKKSPELEISKISLNMKDGEITGRGKLVLDGSKGDISENPLMALRAISGEGELVIPQGALRALTALDLGRQVESYKALGKFSETEAKKLTPQKVSEIAQAAAPQYVERYARSLKLVPQGDNYRIDVALAGGQLMLNGIPLGQEPPPPPPPEKTKAKAKAPAKKKSK